MTSVQTKTVIFALMLVATNWHYSRLVRRPDGWSSITFSGAGFWSIVCTVLLILLIVRLSRLLRYLLDIPVRVPRTTKLFSWKWVLLLLPLFIIFYNSSVTQTADTTTTITTGYGSNLGPILFLLASLNVIFFQILESLKAFTGNPKRS